MEMLKFPISAMIKYPCNYPRRPKKQNLFIRRVHGFHFSFSWRCDSLVSSGLWKPGPLPSSVCTNSGSTVLPESHLHRQRYPGEIFLCPHTRGCWAMPGSSSWVGWFPPNFVHITQGREHVKLGYGLCLN